MERRTVSGGRPPCVAVEVKVVDMLIIADAGVSWCIVGVVTSGVSYRAEEAYCKINLTDERRKHTPRLEWVASALRRSRRAMGR